ncbi:ankyrin repeat domain-containing protein [Micrococcus luteus]|uniref:ankyrin repeat domain-containing protein n=1 Tax=Micrococcus luteus TaxID=1270 RepID=UPI00254C9A6F|nr:ankyrin repeat domain-containing protein [Micrococcus luteus]MDK7870724.1 ankyrin repeat domain-containing protein [Micrococcus luteus]MDK8526780.1 ankyrin repeat domain-containing protein [Micrococcus luteus]MDK8730081.1 ankyrin repeat domain-containing protein [Micrococcus luteus]
MTEQQKDQSTQPDRQSDAQPDLAAETTDAVAPSGAPDPGQPSEEMLDLAGRMFDAARTGDVETLEAYIVAGLDPDRQNGSGDTFLTLAADHHQPAVVEMLVDVGADVEKADDRGQRPLTCATLTGDVESMRLLLAAGADPDAGQPSARQTAEMFGGPESTAVLEQAVAAAQAKG